MRSRSTRSKPLDRFDAEAAAQRLESLLHAKGDYGHVRVRPYGQHLRVEARCHDGKYDLIARATALGASCYEVSFRSHTGRWDPLPGEGSLETVVNTLTEELGPFLDASNFVAPT